MENLWKLIVETATRSSIQVFATTHSLDCIQGLARLLKARPDLRDDVSIQKLERSLVHSVSFDAEGILAAADLDIELRGGPPPTPPKESSCQTSPSRPVATSVP